MANRPTRKTMREQQLYLALQRIVQYGFSAQAEEQARAALAAYDVQPTEHARGITRTTLTGRAIIGLLLAANPTKYREFRAHDTRVIVRVPGGGDWSNCTLDVNDETPVVVTLKTYDRGEVTRLGKRKGRAYR